MKVSVITPTIGQRIEYLKEAIKSFIDQDYNDKELIIVSDGGPNLQSLIDSISGNNQIKYFWKENGGASTAYNYGIKNSTGELLCILDDDDKLYPNNSLSARIKAFEDRKLEVVYTNYVEINAASQITKTITAHEKDKDKILQRDCINMATMMWRRSIHNKVGYYPEQIKYSEDWEFKIKCVYECNMKPLNIISYAVRYHTTNKSMTSRRTGEMQACNADIAKRMRDKYGKNS